MTIVPDSVLVESRAARDHQLERISPQRAQQILNKVKALYFAVWKSEGTTTTELLADFYEVPEVNIRQLLKTHRTEFLSDGLQTLRGKDLKEVRDLLSLTSMSVNVTVWTPRAAMRLGMLLRNSAIAQALRTSLLDAMETVIPAQSARIRELELELQVAQAQAAAAQSQERLMQVSSAIVTIHGAGMLGLILGKPEAIVEQPPIVVEKNILVDKAGRPVRTYEGLSKTKLARRYGMKKPQDLVNWLQSMGKEDWVQPAMTAAPCQYVPFEYVPELDRLWAARRGERQKLLGE
jgi:hypothetical protein